MRLFLDSWRVCLLLALLTGSVRGAGVTLLTHGFNGNVDGWVTGMAGALRDHPNLPLRETVWYEIYFVENAAGEQEPRQRKVFGADPLTSDSGEIILLLNWSQISGDFLGVPYSTTNIAPSVASTLMAPNFIPEMQGRALAELPLHLVGHSRGGSMVYEIAKALGQEGLWVDHVSTLDPHPMNNEFDDTIVTTVVDGPATPYVNVLFADNYYQRNSSFLGMDPSGQHVPGAYNRLLTTLTGGYGGFSPRHSNVHLWYHGTMDWNTPANDSETAITAAERAAWWTAAEVSGSSAGFIYSRISNGDRLLATSPTGDANVIRDGMNQVWDFGAGLGSNRAALPSNNGNWPNVITLNISTRSLTPMSHNRVTATREAGQAVPIVFSYQAGSGLGGSPTLHLFLDTDFNPYSGNEIALETVPVESAGVDEVHQGAALLEGTAKALPSVYALGARITDGPLTRYLYAPELLTIAESTRAPELVVIGLAGGIFQAEARGAAGQTFVIEASANLRDWTAISTNTLMQPTLLFEQAWESDATARMFRTRLVQE